jgi:hypothetical protein
VRPPEGPGHPVAKTAAAVISVVGAHTAFPGGKSPSCPGRGRPWSFHFKKILYNATSFPLCEAIWMLRMFPIL